MKPLIHIKILCAMIALPFRAILAAWRATRELERKAEMVKRWKREARKCKSH